MNNILFEDYGEAILYVTLAVMLLVFLAVSIGIFTAF